MPKTLGPEIRFAALAVDICLLRYNMGVLETLLISVTSDFEYKGFPALPGGLILPDETAEQAAIRISESRAGLLDTDKVWMRQQKLYSRIDRDPRGRVVSLAFIALVPFAVSARFAERQDARWMPVSKAKSLAYDHDEVLADSLGYLREIINHSPVAAYLLPEIFTLSQLQDFYQTMLKIDLDARNFRKRILDLDILEEAGKLTEGAAHRPAMGYRFKRRLPEFVPIMPFAGQKAKTRKNKRLDRTAR